MLEEKKRKKKPYTISLQLCQDVNWVRYFRWCVFALGSSCSPSSLLLTSFLFQFVSLHLALHSYVRGTPLSLSLSLLFTETQVQFFSEDSRRHSPCPRCDLGDFVDLYARFLFLSHAYAWQGASSEGLSCHLFFRLPHLLRTLLHNSSA